MLFAKNYFVVAGSRRKGKREQCFKKKFVLEGRTV
jgi:hypothetical protein